MYAHTHIYIYIYISQHVDHPNIILSLELIPGDPYSAGP